MIDSEEDSDSGALFGGNPYRPAEVADATGARVPGVQSGFFLLGALVGIPALGFGGIGMVSAGDGQTAVEMAGAVCILISMLGLLLVPLVRWTWQIRQLAFLRTLGATGSWNGAVLFLGALPGSSLFVPFLFQTHVAKICHERILKCRPGALSFRHRFRPVRAWWFSALLGPVLLLVAAVLASAKAEQGAIALVLTSVLFVLLEYPTQALAVHGAIRDQQLVSSISASGDC